MSDSPPPLRKIALVLASTDHGTMIVNRFDYHAEGGGQGFKPKDAVELFLQEIALEYRNQPKIMDQAKADAEDFLRRVRAGLI